MSSKLNAGTMTFVMRQPDLCMDTYRDYFVIFWNRSEVYSSNYV